MKNKKDMAGKVVSLFILLLTCATHTYGQRADSTDLRRLSLPQKKLALDVDLQGFITHMEDAVPDKQSSAIANNSARMLFATLKPAKDARKRFAMLIIRIEPAGFKGGAESLRSAAIEHYLKIGQTSKGSVKQSAHKQTPLLRYALKWPDISEAAFPIYTGLSTFPAPNGPMSFPGIRRESHHALEAFFVQDDTWVTLRYVTKDIKEDDEKLFFALLDSANIVDTTNPTSSFDYYQTGRTFYQDKEHEKAVAALEKALTFEKEKRQLTQSQWRGMVMTLANALGATDNTERAKEVLEYGVANEPTYPYFHHGLARLHSFFGDLDNTLASLQRVYLNTNQGKTLLGAPIPDPLTDPAFQKFKDDTKFRDAVKAMKKHSKK